MTISQLVSEAHKNATAHGFWNPQPEIGTSLALIHSEISEALEEKRQGNPDIWHADSGKPEGFAIELADAVIRIADLCGYLGIDLESAIIEKMDYNESRPYKHGKQF